jgi:hypothetical protein
LTLAIVSAIISPLFGSLAQLVEQRTFNPFVVGSIPARPTSIQAAHSDVGRFHFLRLGEITPIWNFCYDSRALKWSGNPKFP